MKIFGKPPQSSLFCLLLSFILVFAASCSDSNTTNSAENSNTTTANVNTSTGVKDDAAELTNTINFPEPTDEVVWREENISQKGKKLTAVLKYGNESVSKIIAAAEKHKPVTEVEVGTEDWFPEELTAKTQLSGNESLRGNFYGANDFYREPYAHGRLVRIQDTNYFLLELTTY